jgi:hypothetical protein
VGGAAGSPNATGPAGSPELPKAGDA